MSSSNAARDSFCFVSLLHKGTVFFPFSFFPSWHSPPHAVPEQWHRPTLLIAGERPHMGTGSDTPAQGSPGPCFPQHISPRHLDRTETVGGWQERQSRRKSHHGLVTPKVPQHSQSTHETGTAPSRLRCCGRRWPLQGTATAAGHSSAFTVSWNPLPGLTMLAASSFSVVVFSVSLHFSPSYPLLHLFSPFLLLLSACAYVFSAPNFCHISFLNFSCCVSVPMLMSSVYFTLCSHFAFHFQGLFPFDLCLSACIYTHTDTYR